MNVAGYVAAHIVEGEIEVAHYHEVDRLVEEGALLIDVRNPHERDNGYIPGSINIPLEQLRERLDEIPKDQKVYVSCQVGLRGYLACQILNLNGYQAVNVSGGYKTYSSVLS